MIPLTKKQHKILQFIETYIKENRNSPSFREIMHHFGLKSLATIHKHIETLQKKGAILVTKGVKRSLSIPQEINPLETELPLVGMVSQGHLIETFFDIQTIAIPSRLISNPSYTYLLQAKENSLHDELISDRDLLIVEARFDPIDGETVVAEVNHQETHIKRYYREDGFIKLTSRNLQVKPLHLLEPQVKIQGVLAGLFRLY